LLLLYSHVINVQTIQRTKKWQKKWDGVGGGGQILVITGSDVWFIIFFTALISHSKVNSHERWWRQRVALV
jgi:hypothetical protein